MASKDVNHAERAHALLSASGASRWINCPPSARLEEHFPEDRSSDFANEGTLAHEFGDVRLQYTLGFIDMSRYIELSMAEKKNKLYSPEMDDEVEKYVDYCVDAFHTANRTGTGAEALIEERFDLTEYIEDSFGTGDFNIIADDTLEIIDLKYGKGIRVDAKDNSQLKLYGLGALKKYELSYDIHTIKMTIVQPRLDHISSWEISVAELEHWGETVVRPKAKLAYAGEGQQCSGDWCRWCKCKAQCATFAKQSIEAAKIEFQDEEEPKNIQLLTDDQMLEIYAKLTLIQMWIKAVDEHIKKEALAGKKWEGYKLVSGKSDRKWSDEEGVKTKLLEEGFESKQFINTTVKIKGIGDIEKLVGKKEFPTIMGDLVIKPAGAPTLVPNSDKRIAINSIESAKEDFRD